MLFGLSQELKRAVWRTSCLVPKKHDINNLQGGGSGLGEDETMAMEATSLQGDTLDCTAGHFHSLFSETMARCGPR
jgi:hypothetical protein